MNRRDFLTLGLKSFESTAAATSRPNRVARRNADLSQRELASRFLAQATFGPTLAEIDAAAGMGFEAWIEDQFTRPKTDTTRYLKEVIAPMREVDQDLTDIVGKEPFRWAWWQAAMTGSDLLRQRVALALSEIMVISTGPDELEDSTLAVSSYFDMLVTHAFGNFRDLLFDVTMSPAMGFYLSHAGNRKADPVKNTFPDENYAREIMQLFSIGLYELNDDGSRKTDRQGREIPTYDNDDIKEFAKIFTGLTYADPIWFEEEGIESGTVEAFELTALDIDNGDKPLKMYDGFHAGGTKTLLNGYVIPAGQSGMQDINDTIDHLFNHPNVGPFIGRLLIQRLVKSNPSPAYVGRVTAAFNDNGRGVRGDMKAVVKAILLDPEARDPRWIGEPTHGMLREPFIRYVQICRALEAKNRDGENRYYNGGTTAEANLGQYPFASPSVFNFFLPSFTPLGPLGDAGIHAPEFQITTSVTSTKTFNFFADLVLYDLVMDLPIEPEEPDEIGPEMSPVRLDLTPYIGMEGDVSAVIDRLDLLFTYGTLSAETRSILETKVSDLSAIDSNWERVVRFAIVLLINSPEYAILK